MRIRTIKPEWLDDERLVLAPATARVLSVSLIVMADDAGRGRANVTMLAARVFPGETCPRTTAADSLACLVSARFVEVYEVDGQTYYQIRNWAKHQKIDRPKRSQLPPPPCNVAESKDSTIDRRAIVDSSTIHRRAVDEETSEDRDLDRTPTGTGTPATTAVTEPTISDTYSRLRSEAWKAKHGKPGGRYQRSPRDYDPMHHAIAFFAGESDPLAALDDSMRGYFADEWATGADWPFSVWAKDPGKYQGKAHKDSGLAAEVKRLEADFTARNRAIDVAAPERRKEAEKLADAAGVALNRARARLRATEARQ